MAPPVSLLLLFAHHIHFLSYRLEKIYLTVGMAWGGKDSFFVSAKLNMRSTWRSNDGSFQVAPTFYMRSTCRLAKLSFNILINIYSNIFFVSFYLATFFLRKILVSLFSFGIFFIQYSYYYNKWRVDILTN